MAFLGKNIIENLTLGMYDDSRIVYREYIQNSADAIDSAIKHGICTEDDDYIIDINIDTSSRNITIYDNATGISATDFQRKLTDIANSDKDRTSDKGFRGIGRLGGLAYCSKLRFSSSAVGENIKSIMILDAQKCRDIINDDTQKPNASELLESIITYDKDSCSNEEHFFQVELVGVNPENEELLDVDNIRNWLSFVAPVPFATKFLFKSKIYDFIEEENLKRDEYNLYVNGEQLFKKYTTIIYDSNGKVKEDDEVKDIHIEKIVSNDGELLAWIWYGISNLDRQLHSSNLMRGMRFRKENIQIGNELTLTAHDFFSENRGSLYFIGEIHCISSKLIPNARRDYFNENPCRVEFENKLKDITRRLGYLYHFANKVTNAVKKIDEYNKAQKEFDDKEQQGTFTDREARQLKFEELEKKKAKAQQAQHELELRKTEMETKDDSSLKRVYGNLTDDKSTEVKNSIPVEESSENVNKSKYKKNKSTILDRELSKFNKRERNLLMRVFGIIRDVLDKDLAEELIAKICKELGK